jgi:hypothetical protein
VPIAILFAPDELGERAPVLFVASMSSWLGRTRWLSILVLVAGCGGGSTCSLVGTWTGVDSHGLPLTVAFATDGTSQWLDGGMLTKGTWHGMLVQFDDPDENGGGGTVSVDGACRTLSLGANGPLLTRVSDQPLVGATCFPVGSSSCACTMGPQASPNPICDKSVAPDSTCCAAAGWPSDSDCECAPLLCQTFPLNSGMTCGCSWGVAGVGGVAPEVACGGAAGCCLADDGSSCTCYSTSSTDCSARSAHQVPSCSSADFPPSCSSGTMVSSCSG